MYMVIVALYVIYEIVSLLLCPIIQISNYRYSLPLEMLESLVCDVYAVKSLEKRERKCLPIFLDNQMDEIIFRVLQSSLNKTAILVY